MLPTTLDLMFAGMKTDPSLDATARKVYGQVLRTDPDRLARMLKLVDPEPSAPTAPVLPAILRRRDVAARLSCNVRTVDLYCKQGLLRKRVLGDRRRACGITAESLDALIRGQGVSA